MYFVVNKENFVIAASEKFLQKIGARDICLISSMYRDGSIEIDEENNELKIIPQNMSFDAEQSKLYSAFGELKHYRIYSKDDVLDIKEEDNNSYLKKLKKGVIEKEDDEFSIPEIATLKQVSEDIIPESKELEPKESESNQQPISSLQALMDKESNNEAKEQESVELTETQTEVKALEELKDEITPTPTNDIKSELTESISSDNKNTLAPIENETLEELDAIKSIEPLEIETNDTQIEKVEERTEDNINIPPIPLEKIKIKQEKRLDKVLEEKEEPKEDKLNILKDKDVKETNENESINSLLQEIKDIKQDAREVKEEKPAESLANDNDTSKEKMVKIDTGIIDDEIDLESSKKKSFFPWSKKESQEKDLDNNKEEIANTQKLEAIKEELVLDEKVETSKQQIEDENDELDALEQALLELETENQATTPTKVVDNIAKQPSNQENSEYDALEKSLLELEAEDEKAPTTTGSLDKVEPLNTTTQNSTLDLDKKPNNSLIEKILYAQITSLDLEENANYLNLDLTSYKMLLESYINEIETHKVSIYNKNNKTIDMLIDAGQLLNVDSLVHKLTKLKNSTDDKSENIANEIEIYATLLKKKLSPDTKTSDINEEINTKKEAKIETVETPKREETIKIENSVDTLEEITTKQPESVIKQLDEIKEETSDTSDEFLLVDLTNDKELLNAVTAKEVQINIKQTAKELALPENLVDEFVRDFDLQSKEHLPILIKAYKNKDTKQLHDTAHMLKGAATNLRLNQIAETLLRLQKEKDLDKVAQHIKKFAAYTKGLDIAIKKLENSDNENQK